MDDAPTNPDPATPGSIDGYRVVRVLGSGGMATVYAAMQEQPRRMVAVKVMKSDIRSDRALRRFGREIEILGRLRHPGIAQVYGAGTWESGGESLPYFVMEYVPRAMTILQFAAARQLDRRARLHLFLKVCAAVEHGHRHKVVHRDLKPANVLVDEHGQVKVIDFGVARLDEQWRTHDIEPGRIVGTISSMAPEQLDAEPRDVDARCDVYSLGVLLFRLLTNRLPHELTGLPLPAAIERIRTAEPIRPSAINDGLAGPLEQIVLTALARDPERRYAHAGRLGRAVLAHLRGEPPRPVQAAPASARSTARWVGIAAAALLLAAAIIGALVLRERRPPETVIEPSPPASQPPPPRQRRVLDYGAMRVEHVVFDGTGDELFSALSNTLVRWSTATGRGRSMIVPHQARVVRIATLDDGRLMTIALDGTLAVVDPTSGASAEVRSCPAAAVAAAVSPDGRFAAVSADDLRAVVIDLTTGERRSLRGSRGALVALAAGREQIVAGSERDAVYVFDAASGRLLRTLGGLHDRIVAVGIAPGGMLLAGADAGGTAARWTDADEPAGRQVVSPGGLDAAAFDRSLQRVLVAGGGTIRLWDLNGGLELWTLALESDADVADVAIDAAGRWCAVGLEDGSIELLPVPDSTKTAGGG